ncbi:MAG: PBP1A family penicillin-binding protein [Deltaproteobacteria bacterium]|nr:PBP1A family penicillin-binding protein [Deltaproteobacteria bacterium]
MTAPPIPPAAPLPTWRKVLRWGLFLFLALANAALVTAVAGYTWLARGLPSVPALAEYRPPVVSELVSSDGQVVGELFEERRRLVPYQGIPRHVVQAFLAAEDKNFFEHHGVDWLGTLRAGVNTYLRKKRVQGGSTITQQTAKALLVSTEGFAEGTKKNLRRKAREAILASRLERAFGKQELLWLYLNGVYLGHHSYGVESAAENYFRKSVGELTLAEAALLAGLPQAPSRYSPVTTPEEARRRRSSGLRRMREDGAITEEERRSADETPVQVHAIDDPFREIAPFYSEAVRRRVVERHGNPRVLRDGLRIETAMDLDKQRAAQQAMLHGLLEVDRRQGFWGPVGHVEGAEREALRHRLGQVFPSGALRPGDFAVGIVSAVNDGSAQVRVEIGDAQGVLPIAGMRWARPPNSQVHWEYAQIDRPSLALRVGDVVLLRRVEREELQALERQSKVGKPADVPEAPLLLALEQDPRLQGALVALDPTSGYVDAMVGGYDFEASEFNRAFQGCRQPGSAFKPILYSAAIEHLGLTPSTLLTDAPVVFRDDERSWKPQNFGEDFKGEVPLRSAVIHSMNIPAVKVAEKLAREKGIRFLGEWAASLGLTSPVRPELGSALGASCATLMDLVNVYAVFDRQGLKRRSTLVKRVLDREGALLEDHVAPADPWVPLSERLAGAYADVREEPQRVIEPRAAFVLQHLLQEVATVGTGAQAARLGKPAGGKTGTTNDSFDTWFLGFTADQVAGVWLGFDHNEQPLGRAETGGRAALPIWLAFMQAALRDRPQPDFPVPDGIVFARIDPKTGAAVPPFAPGVLEPYLEGSAPAEQAEGEDGTSKVDVRDIFAQ